MLIENETILAQVPLKIQGYSNKTYLLKTEKKEYILRLFQQEDINRKQEYAIHELASKENLTSTIIYHDENRMITSFIEGVHKEKLVGKELKLLAKVLKKLHSLPFCNNSIILNIKENSKETFDAFNIIENSEKVLVLCHNDLNPKNIIFNSLPAYPKLIDWEYAGVNDCYFDLASVCVEFYLGTEEEKFFLNAYFNKSYNQEKLDAYKIIYKHLCKEWFIALENSGYKSL